MDSYNSLDKKLTQLIEKIDILQVHIERLEEKVDKLAYQSQKHDIIYKREWVPECSTNHY